MAKNDHQHADANRRRQGALERLQAQFKKLNTKDASALFIDLHDDEHPVAAEEDDFKKKIAYVEGQIKILQDRMPKKDYASEIL